jgi:hypothetical protein
VDDLLSESYPGLEQGEFEEAELILTSTGEPCSFAEAEREEAWQAAMSDEINSVERNKTWELVNLPAGHQAIRLKWVFKLKRDEVGLAMHQGAGAHGLAAHSILQFPSPSCSVSRKQKGRLVHNSLHFFFLCSPQLSTSLSQILNQSSFYLFISLQIGPRPFKLLSE